MMMRMEILTHGCSPSQVHRGGISVLPRLQFGSLDRLYSPQRLVRPF